MTIATTMSPTHVPLSTASAARVVQHPLPHRAEDYFAYPDSLDIDAWAQQQSAHSAELWQQLLDGHWQIAERIDRGGLRFIVARKSKSARKLSALHRQIGDLVGSGSSAKAIAITLEISVARVLRTLTSLQRVLRLTSRYELASLFASNGLRARLSVVQVGAEQCLLGRYVMLSWQSTQILSQAECSITSQIVDGASNAAIARLRQTSERTVANQMQSIFRKLRVRSRSELAAAMQASGLSA